MPKKGKSRPKQKVQQPDSKEEQQQQPQKKTENTHFSLYDMLEVTKTATAEEIKKQYRKLVLQYHPDKNQDDPTARQKFQKLKQAYDILIDPQQRKEYDETGRVGQEFNQNTFESAYQYFRKMFKPVTKQDINSFEKEYKKGPMEIEDLLNYYNDHEGDMVQLIESIPLSTNEDIPRFIFFFQEKIKAKELTSYKNFEKTKNKVRKLKNEEKEFEQDQKKGMGALMLAIKTKQQQPIAENSFIKSLEQKYGVGQKKKAEKSEKAEKSTKDKKSKN